MFREEALVEEALVGKVVVTESTAFLRQVREGRREEGGTDRRREGGERGKEEDQGYRIEWR